MDYFDERRLLIDAHLRHLANAVPAPAPLLEPVRRALASAGKRVRGLLLIAAGEAAGSRAEKLLDAAAAMEMIHVSSLILDDLPAMDDATMRRGEPALHRLYGEDLAILTAVALLNHAYGLLSANHAVLSPRRWGAGDVMQRVVDAVGWDGTIAGEAVDLHSEGTKLEFDTLEFIHSRKTGALFVAAAAVGAMLANGDGPAVRRMEVYAKNLGLAFQITDDVLDVTGTAEQLGKDVGRDEQKLTFVKLAGIEGARQLAGELVETSLAAIAPMRAAADPLRQLAVMVRDRTR
ncbi:MAG TPA: polyprenyl synthetase family protein [Thermoanaerobaculia bacterium]|nr:polyprenyl synthetase family protein [Thermoanaerobaculia bacterium]